MKNKFNYLSVATLLACNIFAATNKTTFAEAIEFEVSEKNIQIITTFKLKNLSNTKLSAKKLLSLADQLSGPSIKNDNEKLVFSLVSAAANKGLAEAQFRLAGYFMEGDIVVEDGSEASFWLEEAIGQNHKDAKFIFENIYPLYFEMGC